MNEQAGLAGAGAIAPQDQERQMIDEIKAMLLQGVDPQELLSQGVPQEIIQIAIQELEAEMAQQQQPVQAQAVTQPGLAMQGAM